MNEKYFSLVRANHTSKQRPDHLQLGLCKHVANNTIISDVCLVSLFESLVYQMIYLLTIEEFHRKSPKYQGIDVSTWINIKIALGCEICTLFEQPQCRSPIYPPS
jgi:hypothetical protein